MHRIARHKEEVCSRRALACALQSPCRHLRQRNLEAELSIYHRHSCNRFLSVDVHIIISQIDVEVLFCMCILSNFALNDKHLRLAEFRHSHFDRSSIALGKREPTEERHYPKAQAKLTQSAQRARRGAFHLDKAATDERMVEAVGIVAAVIHHLCQQQRLIDPHVATRRHYIVISFKLVYVA